MVVGSVLCNITSEVLSVGGREKALDALGNVCGGCRFLFHIHDMLRFY